LALARMHTRDLDGAESAYKSALAADPNAVDAWVGLATLSLVREDYAAALAAYDQLRARRPKLAVAELGRAYALAKMGRRTEAKEAIDHAEALGGPPENVRKLRELLSR
jgi:tetratricopeptide (TPR) repeat protein